MFAKTRAAIKALAEIKKTGGMLLCVDCMKNQMAKNSPNPDEAMKSSLNSNMYTSVTIGDCFICGHKANYKVELADAMKAIKAHRR